MKGFLKARSSIRVPLLDASKFRCIGSYKSLSRHNRTLIGFVVYISLGVV